MSDLALILFTDPEHIHLGQNWPDTSEHNLGQTTRQTLRIYLQPSQPCLATTMHARARIKQAKAMEHETSSRPPKTAMGLSGLWTTLWLWDGISSMITRGQCKAMIPCKQGERAQYPTQFLLEQGSLCTWSASPFPLLYLHSIYAHLSFKLQPAIRKRDAWLEAIPLPHVQAQFFAHAHS